MWKLSFTLKNGLFCGLVLVEGRRITRVFTDLLVKRIITLRKEPEFRVYPIHPQNDTILALEMIF